MSYRFAIIGAAGYIAPRHMAAIKATGGELSAAYDPSDSVGILDSYEQECRFFTEFERFDRHINKNPVHFVVVCSPNYLHDSHCRWAMRSGADVICEKPLVVNPANVFGLGEIERKTYKRVNAILQCRLHSETERAKSLFADAQNAEVFIKYVTPRGKWYQSSWKANPEKSGGLVTNIGIHLFDWVCNLFGAPKEILWAHNRPTKCSGTIQLERARLTYELSIDAADIPKGHKGAFRQITVDGVSFDLSSGFNDLHTKSYERIMDGHGFGIDDCLPSLELVANIRKQAEIDLK